MITSYEVCGITRFRSKELGPEELSSCELIQELGMEGDKYAKGGERQLTLIGSRGKEWIQMHQEGFCVKKCKENLCLIGSLQDLKRGDQIRLGGAILEITIDDKECYPELCKFHHHDGQKVMCLLQEELRYAKVIWSGKVEKQMNLTHINNQGRATMVDVSAKDITTRVAEAIGYVYVNKETFQLIKSGGHKKGDVLGTAQIAGIMAAKRTPDLIPMCHTILLSGVDIRFELEEEHNRVVIISTVKCQGMTGVEMEALTAVSVAALTIYDMCKAVQKDIHIEGIKLLSKIGGKSGEWFLDGQ